MYRLGGAKSGVSINGHMGDNASGISNKYPVAFTKPFIDSLDRNNLDVLGSTSYVGDTGEFTMVKSPSPDGIEPITGRFLLEAAPNSSTQQLKSNKDDIDFVDPTKFITYPQIGDRFRFYFGSEKEGGTAGFSFASSEDLFFYFSNDMAQIASGANTKNIRCNLGDHVGELLKCVAEWRKLGIDEQVIRIKVISQSGEVLCDGELNSGINNSRDKGIVWWGGNSQSKIWYDSAKIIRGRGRKKGKSDLNVAATNDTTGGTTIGGINVRVDFKLEPSGGQSKSQTVTLKVDGGNLDDKLADSINQKVEGGSEKGVFELRWVDDDFTETGDYTGKIETEDDQDTIDIDISSGAV